MFCFYYYSVSYDENPAFPTKKQRLKFKKNVFAQAPGWATSALCSRPMENCPVDCVGWAIAHQKNGFLWLHQPLAAQRAYFSQKNLLTDNAKK